MSTDVTTVNNFPTPVLPSNFADIEKVSGSVVGFLPFVSVAYGTSKVLSDPESDIRLGDLYISKGESCFGLKKQVSLLVLSARMAAKDFNDGVKSSFDMNSALFKQIEAKAAAGKNSRCSVGAEYLMYIPNHGFVTMHFGNLSLRGSTTEINQLLSSGKTAMTFTVRMLEKTATRSALPVIDVTPCEAPFADIPTQEEITTQVEKFLNTKDSAELAPEETRER